MQASRPCVPQRLDQLDQNHVGLARLGREARHHVPEVGGIELRVLVDLAREESGAQRAERHEADAKFLQGRQKLSLRTALEQRVLALHRSDRLDGVRAANRLNRRPPTCRSA